MRSGRQRDAIDVQRLCPYYYELYLVGGDEATFFEAEAH